MKIRINQYLATALLGVVVLGVVSCNDFLDRKPYNVSTDAFLKSDADLFAYSIARYGMFPTNGGYNIGVGAEGDNGTDNQLQQNSMGNRWLSGERKVGSGTDNWGFGNIYTTNYFLRKVLPKIQAGTISGNMSEARHCLGEMYFFRAYSYYPYLVAVGDFPIIYNVLPDQKEPLLEASVRQPRNKVARMILADLDSALMYMYDSPVGGKNRLGKDAVNVFRSRVALFEGTWEKNFAGTAFVPNGPGWPGASQHKGYAYDNAAEVKFFLGEAMKSAKAVADHIALAANPAGYNYKRNDGSSGNNPYFEMFGMPMRGLDAAEYAEVIFYRSYDVAKQIAHYTGSYLIGGGNTGFTHQFMQSFLMQNGKPYYAAGSGYLGDDSVNMMKIGRDSRFQLFVKGQGEILNNGAVNVEPYKPFLLDLNEQRATTGYMIKKGVSRDPSQTETGAYGTTATVIFRAGEAYLNYVEACYERDGALDGSAEGYWKQLRQRALVSDDLAATDAETNMSIEAENDFGAYTAGKVIEARRYNIRRERRCEFIAEGMRFDDLLRWRAMDQLVGKKFMLKGFNLWSSMYKRFEKDGKSELREPTTSEAGNVSGRADGNYLLPLRLNIAGNNLYKDGITWVPAHYLGAIGGKVFQDATPTTAGGGSVDVANSVVYQNPGWQRIANTLPGAVGGF
ncbi:MAG: RagB/SusD family nutrient uptake outer membrane protein [Mucinivorans sp.]